MRRGTQRHDEKLAHAHRLPEVNLQRRERMLRQMGLYQKRVRCLVTSFATCPRCVSERVAKQQGLHRQQQRSNRSDMEGDPSSSSEDESVDEPLNT